MKMHSFIKASALLTFFILHSILLSSVYAEPPNITSLKKQIRTWHDSGRYNQEVTQVTNEARTYIFKQIQKNNQRTVKKKLAIVLDIDETSLSNYDAINKRDFKKDLSLIHQEILAADAPPIKPILKLYQYLLKEGVSVFFVTGRDTSEQNATIHNLKHAGFTTWSGLYLRPKTYPHRSIIPFKTKARADINNKGYTIIANFGDQYSDLIGGHALKTFKLPNPFYCLP